MASHAMEGLAPEQSTQEAEALRLAVPSALRPPPLLSAPYKYGGHTVRPRPKRTQQLTGVVLAGGKSTRLGQDKVSLRVHGDETPLLLHVANQLGELIDEIWISCQRDRVLPEEYANFARVHDFLENAGPLCGITAALRMAKGPIFVMACDMPFMQSAMLKTLIHAREAFLQRPPSNAKLLMTTFQSSTTEYLEPLASIYEYDAIPYFERGLEERCLCIQRLIAKESMNIVQFDDDKAQLFFNINGPQELNDMHSIASQKGKEKTPWI